MLLNDDLSIPEAMRELGVTHTTVQNMIKRGDLVVTREAELGSQKRVFVSRASVEEQKAKRSGQIPNVSE